MPVRAFVLEDNPAIRQGLVEALAELAGVETAGTATRERDAVAWLRDPSNAWDVAVIDLTLAPGDGSGFGVLQALAGRDARHKVVVLTGTASPDVRRRCEALGSDRVFDKAMDTEALIDYCAALASG